MPIDNFRIVNPSPLTLQEQGIAELGAYALIIRKGVRDMDNNGCLEKLEISLYQRIDELVAERRYAEAEQVAHLMQAVGII